MSLKLRLNRWIARLVGVISFLPMMGMADVYDCFTFFHETEVLEVRLNELYDYVDKFVIVEAGEGFSGPYHEYVFEQVKDQEPLDTETRQ